VNSPPPPSSTELSTINGDTTSRVIISSNCLLLCSGVLVHSSVGWADGNSVANDVVVVMVTCHVVTGDLLSIASTDFR